MPKHAAGIKLVLLYIKGPFVGVANKQFTSLKT
jgi:hypothetical protein